MPQRCRGSPPGTPSAPAAWGRKQLPPAGTCSSAGNNTQLSLVAHKHTQHQLTFFPVLMLISLTFSVPVRALSALLLLFLLLLFTSSYRNNPIKRTMRELKHCPVGLGPHTELVLPPACLPPLHILGSLSATWEGPSVGGYAPMHREDHRALIAKKQ